MSKWDDVEERERGKAEFWNTSTLSPSLSLYISLYLSQYPHSKTGCTALDMPEWREITDHKDWRAKQPSQVWLEEDLKCWGAWDTTCRHKAEDIIPLIAWRREVWKEEAPVFLEMTRGSHRHSDEHWNCFKDNFRETSERWDGVHWTELSLTLYCVIMLFFWTKFITSCLTLCHMYVYTSSSC